MQTKKYYPSKMKLKSCRIRVPILTGLALVWLGQEILAQTSLTGEYLGARTQGDEHLLLFKLPGDMITGSDDRSRAELQDSSLGISHQERVSQDPMMGLESNEQPISLTIPLTNLRESSIDDNPLSNEFIYIQQQSPRKEIRQQRLFDKRAPQIMQLNSNNHEQVPYQSPLVLMNNDNEQNFDAGNTYFRMLSPQANLEQDSNQQYSRSKSILEQSIANVSALEQQMRQLLREKQMLQQQIQKADTLNKISTALPQPFEPITEGPQLWRDTLIRQNQKQNQEYNFTNGTGSQQSSMDSAALLNRLASSSPELLVRLRNMIRRASIMQAKPSSLNGTSNEQTGRGFSYSDVGDLSGPGPSSSEKTALQSFLQSQNVTSHEEIKIPLVVIAMPRILSLKRDQMLSNSQKSSSPNNTLLGSQFANQQYMNLTQNPMTNSTGSSTWLRSLGSSASAVTAVSPNSNLTNSQSEQVTIHQLEPISEQHLLGSTLSPQHTMAPYARQFSNVVSSGSLARYIMRPALKLSPGAQVKLSPVPMTSKNHYAETNVMGSRFAYPPSQVAKSVVEIENGRQNVGQERGNFNSNDVSSIEQQSNDNSPTRDQVVIRVNRENREPDMNQVRLIQVKREGSNQRIPAAYEYQVQTNDKSERDRTATQDQSLQIDRPGLEETLSRLRPLLQATRSAAQTNQDRLSNDQMLEILNRSNRVARPDTASYSSPSSPSSLKNKSPKIVFMVV